MRYLANFFESIPAIASDIPATSEWLIYIIETSGGDLYTGITKDFTRRMKQHRGETPGGAKYLRNKGPFVTRQLWHTHNRSRATQFEMWVKSLSKKNKLQLIAFPDQTEFDDVVACERLDRKALLRE